MIGSAGITLTEAHFRDLVAGKEIRIPAPLLVPGNDVRIMLADMGWDRMIKALADAGAFSWPSTYEEAVERFRQGEITLQVNPPRYACFPCGIQFDSDHDLVNHVQTVHQAELHGDLGQEHPSGEVEP